MKLLRLLICLIIPILSGAQTIKGYIYDAESIVKGAKVLNITQNMLSFSDDNGVFEIKAKLSDTIIVTSYFHSAKTHVVSQNDFNDDIVIELKKITNELDEVQLNKTIEKKLDTIDVSRNIRMQLVNDMKNNPHLYSRSTSNGNIDFIAIGKLIGKLFKRKDQIDKTVHATSTDLKSYILKSDFYNTDFLTKELNIPKDYNFLFLEFCAIQNIDLKLLSDNHILPLLDIFTEQSKTFLKELETYQKD